MKNRTYYLFITQNKYYQKVKFMFKFDRVWTDLLGAGYSATITLNRDQLNALKVKLWGSHAILLRVKQH